MDWINAFWGGLRLSGTAKQNPVVFQGIWTNLARNISQVDVEIWVDEHKFVCFRLINTGKFDHSPSIHTLKFFKETFRTAKVGEDFDIGSVRAINHTNNSAICIVVGDTCYLLKYRADRIYMTNTPVIPVIEKSIEVNGRILVVDSLAGDPKMFNDRNCYVICKNSTKHKMIFPKIAY